MSDQLTEKQIAFFHDPKNMRVVRGHVTDGNAKLQMGCHHRSKGRRPYGYCGGCAARLQMAMNVVEKLLAMGRPDDATRVIETVSAAKQTETES